MGGDVLNQQTAKALHAGAIRKKEKRDIAMITEYEIRFALPDIGRVPDNFKDFLNILENLIPQAI